MDRAGPMAQANKLTVFYDGACPLCHREIAFYRGREGADEIAWVDVSRTAEDEVAPGLSKDSALARFHVLRSDGSVVSGGRAFAELWTALPGFRLLGRVFRARPLAWTLNRAYVLFLKYRPCLQAAVASRATDRARAVPAWLLRDLRSNHAGETGAVAIYRGILAVSRSDDIRGFAERHLETERRHLALIETVLPERSRSVCLPLWRVAGFLTGAVPALFGPGAVFATIDAVETFVDGHYRAQVERLSREGGHDALRDLLERCRGDELRHRDEARGLLDTPRGIIAKAWCRAIGAGSAVAAASARRL